MVLQKKSLITIYKITDNMTRRNDTRNNRRNRQRNNNSELNQFAQMRLGALLGKGAGMITEALMKKAEEKTEDKPHTGIRQSGNLLESSCIINGDGSATEIPIPDGYQIFISEDGKPMIRKKIEGDKKKTPDDKEGKPITYDDICRELFLNKDAWFLNHDTIDSWVQTLSNFRDLDNCTSKAQAKRMIAFNKLQNIAKYLNDGWKPNFDDILQEKFYISYTGDEPESDLPVDLLKSYQLYCKVDEPVYESSIYFKTEKRACEAIRVMGKESLNDLFSTDW